VYLKNSLSILFFFPQKKISPIVLIIEVRVGFLTRLGPGQNCASFDFSPPSFLGFFLLGLPILVLFD
jgi:hypothetical protein